MSEPITFSLQRAVCLQLLAEIRGLDGWAVRAFRVEVEDAMMDLAQLDAAEVELKRFVDGGDVCS